MPVQRIGLGNASAASCRFTRCFFKVSEVHSIVVEHGRLTAPDVEVVARHVERLVGGSNAVAWIFDP